MAFGDLKPCAGAIARVCEDWEGTLKKGQLVEILGPTCGRDVNWHWTVRPADAKEDDAGVSLPPQAFEVVAISCCQKDCELPAACFILWPGKGRLPHCLGCAMKAKAILDVLGSWTGAEPLRQL